MSHSLSLPSVWPRGRREPRPRVAFKSRLDDFWVWEQPNWHPSGEGEHLCLRVRKAGLNTTDVVQALAIEFGVSRRDVGYAGRKDRWGITEQWFSVATSQDVPAVDSSPALPAAGQWQIVQQVRHRQKLRLGQLHGNRFRIRLRNLTEQVNLPKQIEFPNYFGPQRLSESNLLQAQSWLQRKSERQRRAKPSSNRGRQRQWNDDAGWAMSVLRAYFFNLLLAERVRESCWSQPLPGDALDADGRASGPLWGRGRSASSQDAAALEERVLSPFSALLEKLEHVGLQQGLRPWAVLANLASDSEACGETGNVLTLEFCLPAGSYATVLLSELFDWWQPDGV